MKEPEEIIESKLIELLAAEVGDISVEGALRPFPDGVVKELPDSYINVTVDQTEQALDIRATSPADWSAVVTVHVARADDPTGGRFVLVCRKVREVLSRLTGDGCTGLSVPEEGFRCDALEIASTQTSFAAEIGEEGSMVKAYTAAISGRVVRAPMRKN